MIMLIVLQCFTAFLNCTSAILNLLDKHGHRFRREKKWIQLAAPKKEKTTTDPPSKECSDFSKK